MRTGLKGKQHVGAYSRWDWLPNWMWRLNFYLGRLIFANMDPLSHHIRSFFVLRRVRAKAAVKTRSHVLFAPEDLRWLGYVTLKETFPPSLVERIRQKAGNALTRPDGRLTRQNAAPDGNHYSWYVKDLAAVVPEVQ